MSCWLISLVPRSLSDHPREVGAGPGIKRERLKSSFCLEVADRPYSYSRNWTGTSRGLCEESAFSNVNKIHLYNDTPPMSLSSKLVPFQYCQYKWPIDCAMKGLQFSRYTLSHGFNSSPQRNRTARVFNVRVFS